MHISYANSQLSYTKTGAGSAVLVLFHGFGQNRNAFHQWEEALKDSHTLYSFDLFFHGASHWNSRSPVEERDHAFVFEARKHSSIWCRGI
jgi:pimeloyl-ACP methyl ester carboxylesterase